MESNKGTVAVPERSHLLVLGKFLPTKFGHFNASMQTRILHWGKDFSHADFALGLSCLHELVTLANRDWFVTSL